MGLSLSWIAVKDMPKAELIAIYKAEKTGKSRAFTGYDFALLEKRNGWSAALGYEEDYINEQKSLLRALSENHDVMSVVIEEHVMYSAATLCRGGKQVWLIEHDLNKGPEHMRAEGELPPCFVEIHERLLAKRRNDPSPCDYLFDVPVKVAQELTGIHHESGDECDNYSEIRL